MIATTKDLFKIAYGRFAIGAYNINNMEQTIGLFQGCIDSQAPFIIQISKGARSYARQDAGRPDPRRGGALPRVSDLCRAFGPRR